MALERLLERVDGLAAVVGAEGGSRSALEQVDPARKRQIATEAQRPRVLGRRLAMCADRLSPCRRGRREAQHRVRVAGGLGVVREPRGIGNTGRRGRERRERIAVQRRPAVRRQRLLDRHAGELVAEGDALGGPGQHARAEAFVEAGELLPRQRLEQPELGLWLGHGHRAEQRPRRRAEARRAGEDGIADGRWDLSIATLQHLREEERVARRPAVELVGVDPVWLGELRHRLGRQPRDLAAIDPPRRGQLPQDDPQPRAEVEVVVAIRGDDQGGRRLDLPREQPQDVEGGLVGPVQVLEHQHGRCSARELAQQCRRHLVRSRAARGDLGEVATCVFGHVEQRTQGARREQRVARAPQDPRRSPVLVGEPPGERRLARAGLAGDEHEPPLRGGAHGVERRFERGELTRSLQQVARVLGLDRRCCRHVVCEYPPGRLCPRRPGAARRGSRTPDRSIPIRAVEAAARGAGADRASSRVLRPRNAGSRAPKAATPPVRRGHHRAVRRCAHGSPAHV